MKRVIGRLVWLLILGLVAFYIVRHRSEIHLPDDWHWGWLSAGTIVTLAGFGLFAGAPFVLLRSCGQEISFLRAVALLYVPMLGKYVPGKIWAVVGAVWLYRRLGVPRGIAVVCILITMLTGVIGGLLTGLALGAGGFSWLQGVLLAAAGLGTMAMFLCSRAYPWFVERLARRWPGPASTAIIGPRAFCQAVAINALGWIVSGLGFVLVVRSVSEVSASDAPTIVALFALAQTAGFLAVFAPAGLGVREGLLAAGLSPLVGEGQAILIAGLARVWQTALELVMAGLGWWILRDPRAEQAGIPGDVGGITTP